jgi:hypothetical protein
MIAQDGVDVVILAEGALEDEHPARVELFDSPGVFVAEASQYLGVYRTVQFVVSYEHVIDNFRVRRIQLSLAVVGDDHFYPPGYESARLECRLNDEPGLFEIGVRDVIISLVRGRGEGQAGFADESVGLRS